MTFVPHLHATSLLFRDTSFDRDNLPDSYHHFGLGVHPHHRRSFSFPTNRRKDPAPVITENGFEVHMDVYDFASNELTVKTYETPRTIVIEAKHGSRIDKIKGSPDLDVERHYIRKLTIPPEIDFHSINVSLSSDGIMSIRAQKMSELNERILPILQTGPAKLNVKAHI